MIKLIYGDDNFRLYQALTTIKASYDMLNISVLSEANDFSKIKSESGNLSFFSNDKLVILKGLAKNKEKSFQEKIKNWLPEIDSSLGVIFVEESELKSTNWLYASIKKIGEVEAFAPLKQYEVTRWIKEAAAEKGGKIDILAIEQLSQMLGNDLWRINNELDKLIAYDKTITKGSIEKLVEPEFLESIFSLMDAISERKERKALVILNKFLKQEDNEIYLISMIARQVRNLISVKELSDTGKKESEIASRLKLHPYVVKNTLRQSHNFTINKLILFHTLLLQTDLDLKSSGTDGKILLFRLVHKFCEN